MHTGRLPNLLVVGVPKAGTGSLFAYLTQHHDICGADEKEIGFFNYYNPMRHSGAPPPVEFYMAHFARCGNERYAMEATPTYSYGGRSVIDAVQHVLERPKIIISLRDPVDRLWSAYTFQRSLGNITGFQSFDAYLDACERRKRDGSDLVPRDHLHGLYIGYYGDYIGGWLEAFGEDLRVVFAEELSRDPVAVVDGLFRWLDLGTEASPSLDLAPRNTTKHVRSQRAAKLVYSLKRSTETLGRLHPAIRRPLRRAYERVNAGGSSEQMTPEQRGRVANLYRASNEATGRLLAARGYDQLPAWLQAAAAGD